MLLTIRRTFVALLLALPLAATAAESARDFNLPAQALADALRAVGSQASVNVVFEPAAVRNKQAPTLRGSYSVEEALLRLLDGTGLSVRVTDGGSFVIGDAEARAMRSGEAANASAASRLRLAEGQSASADARSSSERELSNQPSNRDAQSGAKVEEITVTAQKRSERLQDVPVPVTALSADALIDGNIVRMQDMYNRIPELNLSTGNRGELFLSIRGLTTGSYTNSTVGIVVDELPYGSSSLVLSAPDIDPNELSSIEVLRGPQGTLYGASSLGGLIKYVTVDPSTDAISGRVRAGLSSVENGADLGHDVRGSINLPISDTWAIRASGFARRDPGYIDNPASGVEGVNEVNAYGGRIAALWRPSDAFSMKLGALVQHSEADGNSFVSVAPGFGDLQQDYVRGAGRTRREAQVFSALIKARLGSIDLTSVSGYSYNKFASSLDETPFFLVFSQPIFGVDGILYRENYPVRKFSQEIRLSAPMGQRIEWLFGAFYTHERFNGTADLPTFDIATGTPAGSWGYVNNRSTYEEYAAFADVTVHFTDRFNLQVGGRKSHDTEQNRASVFSGYVASTFFGVDPFIQPSARASNSPTTYMLTPQLKLSSDAMIYARFASGFRPGGPNTGFAARDGLPPTYGPDKTQNYEIGIKGTAFERRLSFDGSLYYIDWKDIQLQLQLPVGAYSANAGRARSRGAELSMEARPSSGLTLAGWIAFNEAKLSEDVPPSATIFAHTGDRLPFSSRYSGNLSVDQKFHVTAEAIGSVGATFVYVGDRVGDFVGPPPVQRLELPAYTQLDLHAGLNLGSWDAMLVVKNVTDKRGTLGYDFILPAPSPVLYIQPRTVGLSLAKSF